VLRKKGSKILSHRCEIGGNYLTEINVTYPTVSKSLNGSTAPTSAGKKIWGSPIRAQTPQALLRLCMNSYLRLVEKAASSARDAATVHERPTAWISPEPRRAGLFRAPRGTQSRAAVVTGAGEVLRVSPGTDADQMLVPLYIQRPVGFGFRGACPEIPQCHAGALGAATWRRRRC